MNKNIIKLSLFFALATMIVIVFNWGQIHSGSIDVVGHNALVNKIMNDGGVADGYQKNLNGMEMYPPLTHYFAAGVGLFFDSSLLGLNIATLISGVIIFTIIGYFLLETGFVSFLFVGIVLSLLYLSKIVFPLIGYEVIVNYFFAQFVATAYFLVVLLWLYRTYRPLVSRLFVLLILINIGLFTHLVPIVILSGASIVIIFMELVQEKKMQKGLGYLVLFAALVGASVVLNPYVRRMVGLANHNGWLSLDVFTTTPTDITIWAMILIIIAGVSGLFFLWKSRNKDIKLKGNNRVTLFLSAVVVSVAGLSSFQYALYLMGLSNPYAIKKYLFILFTFFVILVLSQIGNLLGKSMSNFKLSGILEKYTPSRLLVFPFALLIVFGIFYRPGVDLKPILQYQKQVKHYYQYHNTSIDLHDTISQLPISNTFNLLITSAELQHPWDAVFQGLVDTGSINKAEVGRVVIPSSDSSNYANIIYNSGTIAVVSVGDYYSTDLKDGSIINFNSLVSNKYIISGFYSPEQWGCWSEGNTSTIEFGLNEIKGNGLSLQFLVTPFLSEKHSQLTVDIKINGKQFDTWDFSVLGSYPETKKIIMPLSLLGKDNKLNIEFSYHDAISPQELGLSSDSRKIGLGFISLKVGIN